MHCCFLQFTQKFVWARGQFWRMPGPHGQTPVVVVEVAFSLLVLAHHSCRNMADGLKWFLWRDGLLPCRAVQILISTFNFSCLMSSVRAVTCALTSAHGSEVSNPASVMPPCSDGVPSGMCWWQPQPRGDESVGNNGKVCIQNTDGRKSWAGCCWN